MVKAPKILIVSLLMIPMLSCCEEIEKQLEECEAKLAEPDDTQTAKFQLIIEKDAFATFQPFSNQFHGLPERPFRDGMFVQIGEFIDALHAYTDIELHFADGTSKSYERMIAVPAWIDVECGETQQNPITVEMARFLAPVKDDSNTHHRALHQGFDIANVRITPLTMWAPDSGIVLRTESTTFDSSATGSGKQQHGHVKFTLVSAKECEVRVLMDWPAEGATPAPDVYPTGGNQRVTKIVVTEYGGNTQHGGPHQPAWPLG